MANLEIANLVKRFGATQALAGVELSVRDGEFFCVLGPSAAGKTTLLRTIAGLERVDEGRVHLAGVEATDAPIQARDVAMVFQSFALYPHLSVRQNLAYPLKESGVDAANVTARVSALADQLGITHTLERLPATLSGGEQQRVAIGRAIVRRPRLLLLDEPLTNLDAKLRHDTRAELKRLHRELGITMIYATPDQLEALTMGERIAVLDKGCVQQVGTPDDLYDRPVDRFVASLVGAPTMNFLPAIKRGVNGHGTRVATAIGELAGGPWGEAAASLSDGTELLFGFRPHGVFPRAVDDARVGDHRFEASVHLLEPLGDITVVDLVSNGEPFKMLLPEATAAALRPDDVLELGIAMDETHLFLEENGRAVH